MGARERGGPARRVGRGPARQGARRRRRGRRGDLPRRRRGHRRRVGAVRRRAWRRAATRRPDAAPGRRPGPQPLAGRAVPATRPERRAGVAIVPIYRRRRRGRRDPPRPASPGCAAASSSRRCGSPTRRTTTRGTTRCGRRARTCRCRCTCTRGVGRQGRVRARTSACTPPRCAGGRPGRCGSCSGRACSSATPACASSSPSAARSGPPTCSGRWTSCTTASTAPASSASSSPPSMSMRPSEYFDRNCAIGASNTRRRELARRYEIGVGNLMWGNDFPHPEGTWPHTREFLRDAFCDIPVDETAADARRATPPRCTASTSAALRPLADRIGPTPDELGQDGADLAEVGRAPGRRPPVAHRRRGAPRAASVRDRGRGRRSTRSSRASSPGPTTSTAGCARPSPSTGPSCCRAGCSPGSTTCRRVLRDHSVSSDLDRAKPSPVVDLLRARSARNAARARRDDPRAAGRPRARPHPQAHARAVHRSLDRGAA